MWCDLYIWFNKKYAICKQKRLQVLVINTDVLTYHSYRVASDDNDHHYWRKQIELAKIFEIMVSVSDLHKYLARWLARI